MQFDTLLTGMTRGVRSGGRRVAGVGGEPDVEVVSGNGKGLEVGHGRVRHGYVGVKLGGGVGEGNELLLLPVL